MACLRWPGRALSRHYLGPTFKSGIDTLRFVLAPEEVKSIMGMHVGATQCVFMKINAVFQIDPLPSPCTLSCTWGTQCPSPCVRHCVAGRTFLSVSLGAARRGSARGEHRHMPAVPADQIRSDHIARLSFGITSTAFCSMTSRALWWSVSEGG